MNVLRDLRQCLRSLIRQPLFTAMAIASLALGIGVSTVIFSVVHGLLLRPLPYARPNELVNVGLRDVSAAADGLGWVPAAAFDDLRRDPNSGLSAVTGFAYDFASLTGIPTPAHLHAALVSPDYFRVFAVPPALGRVFAESDGRAAAPPTVILGDGVWRMQFHADPGIIGRSILIQDRPRTVVGVMPAAFRDLNEGCDIWLPMTDDGPELAATSQRRFRTTGRLALDSAAARARLRSYLATVSGRLAQSDPVHYKDAHLESESLTGGVLMGSGAERALWLLLGAVGCVLLVTCANVANLQLVRALGRRREIGMRLALGATRTRIMRHALSESLVLAGLGAGLGILLAAWGVDAVVALLPMGYSPMQDSISLNGPVVWFATLAATGAGMLTGLLPAWVAARQDPAGSLGASAGRGASEGPAARWMRGALVIAEIALALVLLAGAGLMGRSLLAAVRSDVGVRIDRTLMVNLSLSASRYPAGAPRAEFYRRLLESVAALPGVEGVAMTDTPLFSWFDDFDFTLPGQSPEVAEAAHQSAVRDAVNPSAFATLGIPLKQGRVFNEHDTLAAPLVAVVSEEFSRRYFPAGDALGARLGSRPTGASYEIVGIVGSVRRGGLDQEPAAEIYLSYLQKPSSYATIYIRAVGALEAQSLLPSVQSAVWRIDPDQPIGKTRTLEYSASLSVAYPRLYTVLFTLFAFLTLVLAALGIYGTISYSVAQRTREIGIRMALGAQQVDVLRLVLGQGVRLVAVGLALGLGASLALSRLLTTLLYGIKPTDPLTLAAVALLLGGVSLLASWLPARKAARIDPLRALREE